MEHSGKKIKRNLVSGIVYQAVLIALGFLLPRLYLENFGSEVNGVLSTIKQIFTYMCLLEAGVGLASSQALYKPVAENDYKRIGRFGKNTCLSLKIRRFIYIQRDRILTLIYEKIKIMSTR